jgi:hypothetical protein
VRRHVNYVTTTRHIVVEEHSDGVCLTIYEVRRTNDNDGRTMGYDFIPYCASGIQRWKKVSERLKQRWIPAWV